jgi:putative tryptophan/tyrosine transport system substrate-binding protein
LIKLLTAQVRNADEMEGVIKEFAREPNGALLVLPDLFTATNRRSIIALAARHGLPAVYPFRYFVASGGLMSYGIETLETYRQAASYVARVLKGENPGDLPVQAPTKYELVINHLDSDMPCNRMRLPATRKHPRKPDEVGRTCCIAS